MAPGLLRSARNDGGRLRPADACVDLGGQVSDTLGERLDGFGQCRVLPDQVDQQRRLAFGQLLALLAGGMEIFAMPCIRQGMRLVAVRLPRLRQQDQGRRIGGLQAEGEVEQNKGVKVEGDEAQDVRQDPDGNDKRLPDQKAGRPKKSARRLPLSGRTSHCRTPGPDAHGPDGSGRKTRRAGPARLFRTWICHPAWRHPPGS